MKCLQYQSSLGRDTIFSGCAACSPSAHEFPRWPPCPSLFGVISLVKADSYVRKCDLSPTRDISPLPEAGRSADVGGAPA